MSIDRDQVKQTFQEYTGHYDLTNDKIRLKMIHTYRVAELCDRIARAERMDEADVDLAWLLGMLHDIGRFEQLKRYNTFLDTDSVDHAGLGADLLFGVIGEGLIRDYVKEDTQDTLIETAVRQHSLYRISDELDARTKKFCHILRDADKIDILRVNVDFSLEEIYNTTSGVLRKEAVSDEVLQSFYAHKAVLRAIKRTTADHVVGHCSLVFELMFPESLRAVREQGFIWKLLDFESENPQTIKRFREMRVEMERYLMSA
ncbi:MAG: HD domain-containing protein [Lachnospiraceae bacterium]|nr:HD domain-containing protein [Lachnospiraceae bacterium]